MEGYAEYLGSLSFEQLESRGGRRGGGALSTNQSLTTLGN
jgi:hypothetical protein